MDQPASELLAQADAVPDKAAAREPAVSQMRGRRSGGVVLLTLRDVQHRAIRFAAVTLGAAVVFTLLFVMSGLSEQFRREPRATVTALGAEGWLVRDGVSGAFTSAATMPDDLGERVEGAEGSPLVVARHTIARAGTDLDIVVVGYEPGGLGEPDDVDGSLPGAREILIDAVAGLDVGELARIGNTDFTVVGLTDGTTLFAGMPLVFMRLDAAQALVYRGQDLATAVLLDRRPDALPPGFVALSPAAVADDAMRPLEKSISSINLIRVLLWFVAALIIGTMTYLSALERRRDVAVLKAVGASTGQLGVSIAAEGALIALLAAGVATVLQAFVVRVFPLQLAVPARALWQLPVLAVVVALVAGSFGLRSAVRTDPALAFAGPGT